MAYIDLPWRRALTHAAGQPIILASASPRRCELLTQAGVEFEIVISDSPEAQASECEPPDEYARRSACQKAAFVAARCPGRLVLGADTVVAVAGMILGKPADEADAVAMLGLLRGREHEVHTGCALALAADADEPSRLLTTLVVTTQVVFRAYGDDEIAAYVATSEPLDKAGAYGIQGLGGRLVAELRGSYDNVVGLPVAEVLAALGGLRASA